MKIRVVRVDGDEEILEITNPANVRDHNKFMTALQSGNGIEHYFYNGDGRYDGWGKPIVGSTMDMAKETIDRVESARVIIRREDSVPRKKLQ